MSDTRNDVTVAKGTWVDLYAASGIAVGTAVVIINKGSQPCQVVCKATQPTDTTAGIPLLVDWDNDFISVAAGESGLWAYSTYGQTHLLVQDGSTPSVGGGSGGSSGGLTDAQLRATAVNVADVSAHPGDDSARNAKRVISAAMQYDVVTPAGTAAASVTKPVSSHIIGNGAGAAGDYLATLIVSVASQSNSAVYLRDGTQAALASGTTGTNPAGTTALAVTASTAQTWTANQHVNRIVSITYTPTSGESTEVWRKVVANPVVSASTAVSFTLSHAIPAGATITAWSLLPASAWEVVPYNALVGTTQLKFEKISVYGGWRLSVDSGVTVEATGIFS